MQNAVDYEIDENDRQPLPVEEYTEEKEDTTKSMAYQLTGYTVRNLTQ